MAVDIKSILTTLENKIAELAKSTLTQYANAAVIDGKELLTTVKVDLKRWTELLANKKITRKDFETLLLGEKDLTEMSALTQAGLTFAKIDQFRAGIFNLIIDTVFSVIGV